MEETKPSELRHTKYNIFDENGTLTFRYNINVFPPNNHPLGSRTYPIIKIAVVTQGEADWRFKNTVYHVHAGDIVLLRPNLLRSIEKVYPGCSMKCEMYEFLPLFLKYNMNCLQTFYVESDGTRDVIPAGSPDSDRLLSLFSDIRGEVLHPNDMSGEIIRGYLIVALALIDRMMSSGEIRNSVTVTNTNSDPIYDCGGNSSEKPDKMLSSSGYRAFDMAYITNFIDEHLSDEINVDDLAKVVHMSRSHFYKIFRQYNGISVNQYILQSRIKNTVQLLLTNNSNILEAAYQSGFTSSSGFYKAFKQIMGVTPKEYLKFIKGA
ncbi:MAG: AraC family transcriptional regulator [Eubacteriales bacterium]